MKRTTTVTLLVIGIVVVAGTAAIAGSGVGGVFNLGRVNPVNATTQLRGATAGQQLNVLNTSTNANSAGIVAQSGAGTAIHGITNTRIGVRGSASTNSGVNYGMFDTTASPNGYAAYFRNTTATTNPRLGRGIRVLGARGTDAMFATNNFAGGGEFAGPNGVVGYPTFAQGAGIAGFTGTKGNIGVYGISTKGEDGFPGFFQNLSPVSSDPGPGVRGLASGADGNEIVDTGIFARGGGEFIGPHGVIGVSSGNGYGVVALQGEGVRAVLAKGNSEFDGDVSVSGSLSKGSGEFKIDHPLDPENKYLSHSFVESPDMMNIYNGNIVTDAEGEAIVELPHYFEALNRDPRYQLTVIGSPANAYVLQEVQDNTFSIKTSEAGVKVSWQVTGIRQDAFARQHPIVVEEEKAVADRGRYLHPEAFGKPHSLAVGAPAQQFAGAN